MNSFFYKKTKAWCIIMFLAVCIPIQALRSFRYTLRNDVQTSDRTLEFDLFIQDTDADSTVILASIQAGINVDSLILNGGTITPTLLTGTSEFHTHELPIATQFAKNCVKIAPRSGNSWATGTVISDITPGTRMIRVKLTNSVAFASYPPNLTFNWTTSPYPTKFFAYLGNKLNTNQGANSTNTYSLAKNDTLNVVPRMSALAINGILGYKATAKGKITYLGNPDSTFYGLCYSTNSTIPTISDSCVSYGLAADTGSFSGNITGLKASTTYYVRTYATNDAGTGYGDVTTFTTADLTEWTGATDTDWGTETNWSAGVPAVGVNALIPSDLTNYPTIGSSTNASCKNLTLKSGATLLNNGTLNVSGTATVEQYLTGSGTSIPSGRFWYVSSPVVGATSAAFSAAGSNKLWSYSETTKAYSEITDNTTGLTVGQGYVARLAVSDTIRFTGTLYNSEKNIDVTCTGTDTKRGFQLIGNPYTSFLDWDASLRSNMESTIWQRGFNSSNAMVFDTYNPYTKVGTSNNGTAITNEISPMQAFWVKTEDGSTGCFVGFTNSMCSHQTGSGNKLRAAETTNNQIIRLKVSNGSNSDETIILSNENASNDLDSYDSPKMSNENAAIPEIYTLAGNKELVINSLNAIQENQDIALGFRTGENKTFTIQATEISGLDDDLKLFLKDRLTGSISDLSDVTSYSFVSDTTDTQTRFAVALSKNATNLESTTKSIVIYRNEDNQIALKLEGLGNNEGTINVYSILGQHLLCQKINGQTSVVNEQLTPGIYIVFANADNNSVIQKVTIK
jgi:hypothetical protein